MNQHKKLLLFPLVISVATVGILGFFLVPVVLQPTGYSYTDAAHWKAVAASVLTQESMADLEKSTIPGQVPSRTHKQLHLNRMGGGFLVVIYFVSMFLAAFCNVAFCHEIFAALAGRDVSIESGVRFAASRWKAILQWSFFSGLVGLLIQKLEQQMGWLGRWVVNLIGIAWSVASVFAIPVLVNETETLNPLDVLRTSAARLKKTWGESLAGYIGMGMGSGVVALLSLVVLVIFWAAGMMLQSPWLFAIGFFVWFTGLVAFSYVWGVAGLVYRCALYQFAATGTPPSPFNSALMASAWKSR